MLSKISLISIVERVHHKVFGHAIGQEMRRFIVNLSWSFFGGGLIAAIVTVVNIFAGRLMGPEEYGKYSLVLIIISYLLAPIYFGLDISSVRAVARSKNDNEIKENISSSAIFVIFSTALVLTAAFFLRRPLAILFSTETSLIKISLIFTIFLVTKNIFDCFIRAMHLFKYQFIGRLLEACLIVISFLFFFVLARQAIYVSYVYILIIGAAVISIFYLLKIVKYFGKFSFAKLYGQLSYGKFFFLTAVLTTIFLSLDKLIINRYLGATSLGLYSAYYATSFTLVTQITQMFNNVFFPTVSRIMSKAVFEKIDKLSRIGFLPLTIVIMLIVFVLMKLFGSRYSISFSMVSLFSLLGATQIVFSTYFSIILTFSKLIYKKYLLSSNLINLFVVAFYVLLVLTRNVTITSVVIGLIIDYILIILMQRKLIKNYFGGRL